MEIERSNNLNYPSKKGIGYKNIMGGALCILLTVLVCILVYKWNVIFESLQGNWMGAFKGGVVGVSFLPAFLFIGIKIQDKNKSTSSEFVSVDSPCINSKRNRSICLIISAVLGICYSIYIIMHFGSAMNENEIVGTLATALVAPHIFMTIGSTVVTLISYFKNSSTLALIGAILFSVSGVLWLMYIPFLVPSIILGFVGFDKLRKLNKMSKE